MGAKYAQLRAGGETSLYLGTKGLPLQIYGGDDRKIGELRVTSAGIRWSPRRKKRMIPVSWRQLDRIYKEG